MNLRVATREDIPADRGLDDGVDESPVAEIPRR